MNPGNPNPIRVLAVDDSAITREVLGRLIEAQPDMELVSAAANGREAVRRASELQPDIVLMDIHMPDLDGIQAAWLVSSGTPHGAVIMVTSEERVDFLQKAMSAGAQGYVLKPFGKGDELFQTIRQVHARSSARRMQATGGRALDVSHRPRVGKRVVVLGPKGGVGSTMVAVSLSMLLQEQAQSHSSAVLLDADFLAGDAAYHFSTSPPHTILDLVPHIEALDARLIDQVIVKQESGVHLLSRPTNPEQAEALTAQHVKTIVGSLSQMYDRVIIDTALTYDDRMLSVLDIADVYVVVVTPHLGVLRSAAHFLQVAKTLGYPHDRMCFVLNRATSMAGLSIDDIRHLLGARSIVPIPSGGAEVSQAFNAGRPLVVYNRRSPVTRALRVLAQDVQARIASAR